MALQLSNTDIHLVADVVNFPDRLAPISITCWLLSPVWGSADTYSLVGTYLSGTTAIQIGNKAASSGIDVWTWGGTNVISTDGIHALPSNQWIHVAYTWDGATNFIYIDGELITTTTTVSIAGVLNQVYINGYPTGGINETANTQVDDVCYFGRCLSPLEVKTLYTLRGRRDSICYNLLARYCFDEGFPGSEATFLVDHSGNGNNIVPSGPGTVPTYVSGVLDLNTRPVIG